MSLSISRRGFNSLRGYVYKDKEQLKAYRKEWAAKKRLENRVRIQEYKLKMGCADCGYNAHHAGLEFDHISNDKYENVASLMSQTNMLWKEIAKCEVVCATCHAIRSYNRMVELGKALTTR